MSEPTNRREFLRNITVAGAGLAALGPAALQAADVPEPKPAGQTGASDSSDQRYTPRQPAGESRASTFLRGDRHELDGQEPRPRDGAGPEPGRAARGGGAVRLRRGRGPRPPVGGNRRRETGDRAKAAGDFRRCWTTSPSTPSRSRRRTTGTRRRRSSPARRGSTSTSKSLAATTRTRGNCWSRRPASTTASSSTARSGGAWPKNVEAIERVQSGDIGRVLFSRGVVHATTAPIGRPANAGAGAVGARLRPVAGPRAASGRSPTTRPLQLALVLELGHRRAGQQRHPRAGRLPLGPRRRSPHARHRRRRQLLLPRRPGNAGHASVTYDFGDKAIVWERRSCLPRGIEGSQFGIAFYGDKGTLVIDGGGYKLFDPKGKQVESQSGPGGNGEHLQNFIDCIESGKRPNAPIDEGFKSILLCHLGNIAWRTGRVINCDPGTGQIHGDPEAAALWRREYEKGWEPKV